MEPLVEDALRQSREETVSGAEERTGSRELYTSKISPQTEQLAKEVVTLQDAVRAGTNQTVAGVASRASQTSTGALDRDGRRQLLALFTAVLITRSVVRPVRARGSACGRSRRTA